MAYTSPGGRVFGVVMGVLTGGMCVGAFYMMVDALDGTVSVAIGQGRGRLTFSGWQAYAYASSSALLSLATALAAGGFLAGGLGPQRWSPRALAAIVLAYRIFIAAAAVFTVLVIIRLFSFCLF